MRLQKTNARAMGNAYTARINGNNCVILADGGIMQLFHAGITGAKHINNVTADILQRDGVEFFEIEEA